MFMNYKHLTFLFILAILALPISAQKRNINLTLHLTTNTGESLNKQSIGLTQSDYSLSYGNILLDANGKTTLKVYTGHHHLNVIRKGFQELDTIFEVKKDTTINLTLKESFLTPFSLNTQINHNAQTGLNDITLSWNCEKPVFFDDFDSYEPFSTTFGDWIGIDNDKVNAVPLTGNYPNRGVLQYAQIINPLTVDPAWWYNYPVLRPFSGLQYVGFTRTTTGEVNDDWLISPAITLGNQNILQFLAKAGDKYPEKFQVYVTTTIDNPDINDFTLISTGNYESVGYNKWQQMTYDLSIYAGKRIRFAIRYIGGSNNGGNFMLMVDDVYVGQPKIDELNAKAGLLYANPEGIATRVENRSSTVNITKRSPLNPNESFKIYKNDVLVGTTNNYSYVFRNLPSGTYKFGVQSIYKTAVSAIVDTTISIGLDYAKAVFNLTTNNHVTPKGAILTLTNKVTGDIFSETFKDVVDNTHPSNSCIIFPSLLHGTYFISIKAPHYEPYTAEIDVNSDQAFNIELHETIVDPYNITADITSNNGNYNARIKWNQNISFNDSFESYDDFASKTFGNWCSYNFDQRICYPISLNGIIVNYPGASTTQTPKAVAPLVFNPNATNPAMTNDAAILAPDGNKTIAFFSPQQSAANKWLVSPLQTIRENYIVRFAAKAYTNAYGNETMEVAVSTNGNNPQTSDFATISKIDGVTAGQWTIYEADLSKYVGQNVYIGLHYTTYDGFLTQIDQFFVGNPNASTVADVGAVQSYNIYVDGVLSATSNTNVYTLTNLSAGAHTIGIEAVYVSGKSNIANYTLGIATKIDHLNNNNINNTTFKPTTIYNISGEKVSNGSTNLLSKGVYIQVDKQGNRRKVILK